MRLRSRGEKCGGGCVCGESGAVGVRVRAIEGEPSELGESG